MLRRIPYAMLGLVTVAAAVAVAANVHFIGEPTITVNEDNTITVAGKLAGLGNKDINITAEATGTATVVLYNPAGHPAPGQNKVPVKTLGEINISKTEIKNGNVEFSLTTAKLREFSATEFGAPNDQWTAVVTDVDFSSLKITVVQGGKVVLQQTFNP